MKKIVILSFLVAFSLSTWQGINAQAYHFQEGFGVNPDGWTCSANVSSSGTDPIYAKLRLLDFYWRNRGVD